MVKERMSSVELDSINGGATLYFGGYNEKTSAVSQLIQGKKDPQDIFLQTEDGSWYKRSSHDTKADFNYYKSKTYGSNVSSFLIVKTEWEKVEQPN